MSEIPESHFVNVNGVKVHYHDVGEGPDVLIMLHGSGPGAFGWSNFSRNVHEMARHRRVLCVDYPGFGKSDMKPPEAPVPGFWTDILSRMMDKLEINSADFIGNSMGGSITLKLAMNEPQKVNKMVLMGTGGGYPVTSITPSDGVKMIGAFYEGEGPTLEKLKAFIDQFIYDPSLLSEELIQKRFEAASNPKIVACPPMRLNKSGPKEELWRDSRMAQLEHETLLIWGREDKVMPLDTSFVLMKQIQNARLCVFPKCGHWPQWEKADEFNRTVIGFLTEN